MEGVRIEVRLQPRASRDEILGLRDGVLHVRVSAPPVADAANRALCRLIAGRLGIAVSRVEIVRGERGRFKIVAVAGIDAAELAATLG
ncbi:MAG TPA: DUF167 domain-containing protein [Solirubrobacteraceae bacterium]